MARTLLPGTSTLDHSRLVPSDWRQSAVSECVVKDRTTVLEQTNARLFVERSRLEWRPGTGQGLAMDGVWTLAVGAVSPDVLAAQRRERARIRGEKGVRRGGRPTTMTA